MTPFHGRRAFFDHYAERVTASPGPYGRRFTCPCCGYPTLGDRGHYEICFLCNWEDDGQDDADADEARGGPNHGFSLIEGRWNFERHCVMYPPDADSRIGGSDTPEAVASKQRAIAAFELLITSEPVEHSRLWRTVREEERELYRLLRQKIREYEARG